MEVNFSINMSYKDSTFLVTGGSSGFGEETTKLLLEENAQVVIFDINPPPFSVDGNKNLLFIKGDVTSDCDVQSAVEKVKQFSGTLRGIINCAGIRGEGKNVYDFKTNQPHGLQAFEKILQVNTTGTFNIIRLFVPLLAKNSPNQDNERGIIINVASVTAFDWPANFAYAASKAAIVGMTMPLARDLSEEGIRVVSIAPGLFNTPLVKNAYPDINAFGKCCVFPKKVPLPIEFARFVKVIIDTPMLNATTIRLDGGMRDVRLL